MAGSVVGLRRELFTVWPSPETSRLRIGDATPTDLALVRILSPKRELDGCACAALGKRSEAGSTKARAEERGTSGGESSDKYPLRFRDETRLAADAAPTWPEDPRNEVRASDAPRGAVYCGAADGRTDASRRTKKGELLTPETWDTGGKGAEGEFLPDSEPL